MTGYDPVYSGFLRGLDRRSRFKDFFMRFAMLSSTLMLGATINKGMI
jgi:hypothetical protein